MTTGIQSLGQDLDSLLMPRGAHTAISNTNITSNGGVDLAQRFAGVSFGTAYGTTNIKSAGVDIGTLFARIASGPTSYTLTSANFGAFNFDFGYLSGSGGSISPSTYNGYTILGLFTTDNGVSAADEFRLQAASDPGSSIFTTLSVLAGGSRTAASAVYSFSSNTAIWHWNEPTGSGLFNAVTTYSITVS